MNTLKYFFIADFEGSYLIKQYAKVAEKNQQ
jgi:hypothetical protein